MGTNSPDEFSFSTIKDFDAHITREICGYETLFKIATGIADTVITTGTNVYDLGCSTVRFLGNLAERFAAETNTFRRRYVRFIVGYRSHPQAGCPAALDHASANPPRQHRALENAGFDRHEFFWRVNNFVALIAIKGVAANASGT